MDKSQGGRQLGFWMCVALVVGNIIGTGIFMLPAALAPYGLNNSLAAWLFTASGALALSVVFAGLSRGLPGSSGPYNYAHRAFGSLPAFLTVWSYWNGVWVGNAAIATGMVSYLSILFPAIGERPWLAATISISAVWFLTLVNVLGTRKSGRVQVVTTVMKLMPLALIIGLGLYVMATDTAPVVNAFHASASLSLGAFTAAATLTLWPMMGFESASVASDRVRDPERTIPRATLIGAAVVAVVYILAASTVQALVPADALAQSSAPFAEVARRFFGDNAQRGVALFAAISAFGALNGWTLLMGELPYQLAREGIFPRIFAKESRFHTPVVALVVSSLLVATLVTMNFGKSLAGIFQYALLVSTVSTLVLYLVCAVSALRLLRRGELALSPRQAAGLRIAAILGTGYSLWTIVGAGISVGAQACNGALLCWTPWQGNAVYMGALLFILGLPLYFATRRSRLAT